jgi:hypothetical protein
MNYDTVAIPDLAAQIRDERLRQADFIYEVEKQAAYHKKMDSKREAHVAYVRDMCKTKPALISIWEELSHA